MTDATGFMECKCPACGYGWQKSAPAPQALAAAPAVGGEEYAWVIEHGGSKTSSPLYYTGGLGLRADWSTNHLDAIRFGKESDAIAIRKHIDAGVDHHHRVCEHAWTSCAAQPASPLRGREALISVTASLAAAISTLERTPKAKMAAPSNKMFEQMLDDYRRSLELGHAALSSSAPPEQPAAEDHA